MKNCSGWLSIIFTAAFIFLFVNRSISQTLPSYLPGSGLVAWYPFNGNANDESGNGNNGTVYGAMLTSDRDENSNAAYSFNGTSNYINVPYSNSIGVQEKITISAWILMDGGGCNPRVLEVNSDFNQCGGYSLAFNGNSNENRTIHTANLGNCVNSISPTGPIPALQSLRWQHVAYTVDGSTGQGRLYFNGQLAYSYTGATFNSIPYNNNSLTVGLQ